MTNHRPRPSPPALRTSVTRTSWWRPCFAIAILLIGIAFSVWEISFRGLHDLVGCALILLEIALLCVFMPRLLEPLP